MTEQEKDLLLKDLSARIPYGVICKGYICGYPLNGNGRIIGIVRDNIYTTYTEEDGIFDFSQIRPYLRSISSMTEEEKEKYHELCDSYYGIYFDSIDSINWLNANYFDIKGLIPKGLAIEVTTENNPYKL